MRQSRRESSCSNLIFFKGEEINKDFPFSTGEEHGGFRYDVPRSGNKKITAKVSYLSIMK